MNTKLLVITPLLCALGAAPLAAAQTRIANPPGHKATSGTAASSTRPDPRPIEELQMAAQKLRDAIHEMLNEPAGPKRSELIEAGDRALAKVEAAMVNLPPELLTAEAEEGTYRRTIDHLEQATQDLNEAVQALKSDPNSTRRNESIKKIQTALREAHQLMREIPRNTSGA